MEIRTGFHKHLREIQDDILAMGSMVEKAIALSIQALKTRDLDLAHQIMENDKRINQRRFDIEEKCVHLKHALAIVAQLEGTLNFELGGEVAQALKTFYVHSRSQLMKANIENSPSLLHALIENFSSVREAWSLAEKEQTHPPSTEAGPRTTAGATPPPRPGSWRMSA